MNTTITPVPSEVIQNVSISMSGGVFIVLRLLNIDMKIIWDQGMEHMKLMELHTWKSLVSSLVLLQTVHTHNKLYTYSVFSKMLWYILDTSIY